MKESTKNGLIILGKILLSLLLCGLGLFVFVAVGLTLSFDYPDIYSSDFVMLLSVISCSLILPLFSFVIWFKGKKRLISLILCLVFAVVSISIPCIKIYKIEAYKNTEIDMAPNIDVEEYLPYDEDSKIVKLESKVLRFNDFDTLPRIDGAAALFPVYSAFVNATYPSNIYLDRNTTMDSKFEYRKKYTRGV